MDGQCNASPCLCKIARLPAVPLSRMGEAPGPVALLTLPALFLEHCSEYVETLHV